MASKKPVPILALGHVAGIESSPHTVSASRDEQVRPVPQDARHDAQAGEYPPREWEPRRDLQSRIAPCVKSVPEYEGHGGAGAHFGQRVRIGLTAIQ